MEELLVSSLAQTDALAKLLIEKGLITRKEFMQKISQERESDVSEATDATMNIGDDSLCLRLPRRYHSDFCKLVHYWTAIPRKRAIS
jgi:predicted solute-binding protein